MIPQQYPSRAVFDCTKDFDPRKSIILQLRNRATPSPAYYGIAPSDQYLNMTYQRSYQQLPFHLDKKIPKILRQKDPGWKDRGGEDAKAKDFFRYSQANKSYDFGRLRERNDISYLKNANEYVKEIEAEKQRKREEHIARKLAAK